MEVSAPGVEEVKDILHRWEPFHCGASVADWLDNLYSHIYGGVGTRPGHGPSRRFFGDPPCFYHEGGFSADR